ncbi:hypothetical protein Droror1_Dr00001836 [Drosera rotundifolia]
MKEMNARKLLVNERVEVRQVEEGLRGAWYEGVVVGVSEFRRKVKYDDLLSESGKSKLVESIPVTGVIEGVHKRAYVKSKHRGRVRPPPPSIEQCSSRSRLKFGVCVDALFEDAWWEGMIFDCDDGSRERSVFFPDEDDERKFKVSELRISQDWDELSGEWNERGVWMLVKLAEAHKMEASLGHFIKHVWSHLRVNYGFLKMISEWTCGSYCMWKKYFTEALCELATKPSRRSFGYPNNSRVFAVIKSKNSASGGKGVHDWFRASDEKGEAEQAGRATPNIRSKISNACVRKDKVTQRRKQHLKISKLRWLKPVVSPKHRFKRYGCPRSNAVRGPVIKRSLMLESARNTVTTRFRGCRGWGSIGLSNQRSRLKKKKRVPKKIHRTAMKCDPSSKKEGEVPKLVRKEVDISNSPYYNDLRHPSSRGAKTLDNLTNSAQEQRMKRSKRCDSVCFVCNYGEDLLPCDNCLSSYHLTCAGLKDVPARKWFCPSCRCGLCGLRNPTGDEVFTDICYQCSYQYHFKCLNKAGNGLSDDKHSDKFCGRNCFEICARLHGLVQSSNPTSVEGLTWTLARSRRNDCNLYDDRVHPCIQLSQISNALHECFEPIIEPITGRDLVSDVVYNSWSKFKRLDFHGFYLMALLKDQEVTCAATVRIHGHKVAEMPLIATPFKYRRKGMCRLLVHELEKMLIDLGIKRLVLPAIPQLSETWVSSFDFKEMPDELMQELCGFPFLIFQGTKLFQKVLSKSSLVSYSSRSLQEAQRTKPGVTPESDDNRRFRLHYNRRQKRKLHCVKKREAEGISGSNGTLRFVYKRRRVLASRNPRCPFA